MAGSVEFHWIDTRHLSDPVEGVVPRQRMRRFVAEHLDGSWLTKIAIEQVNPAALSSADRSATPADGGYDEFVARCEAISLAAGKAAGGSPTIVADTIYQPVMDRG